MRFGYADPPYPGRAKRYYGEHDDYAGEVDHGALIAQLEDEFPDGWALSTSATALQDVLALCPQPIPRGAVGGGVRRQIRVLAWCKHLAQPGSPGGVAPAARFGWEPVIIRGGRPAAPGAAQPCDWLVATPDLYTMREKPAGHVTGAKPAVFCSWLFECFGARCEDEFVDLFPGSGAVAEAWRAWSAAPQLLPPTSPPAAEVLGV